MCCDGSNFCQHSKIYCPCIIQKIPRDFSSNFLSAILRGGYTSADRLLSVCIGVGGCVCPISPRAWRDGMDSLQLMKSSHSSASAADDMTALMILAIVNTAPLLGGNAIFLHE